MADTKISALPSASALTGAELLAVVQGGTTKRTTTADVAALAPAGGGGGPSVMLADYAGYDPTGATNQAAALALAEAAAGASGTIDFGDGTFAFANEGWQPNPNVHYRGNGKATKIVPLVSTETPLLAAGSGWTISDMVLEGGGVIAACYFLRDCTFRRVEFSEGLAWQLSLVSCVDVNIDDCTFRCLANRNALPTGIIMQAGCRRIRIRRPKMRYLGYGIVGAGGGTIGGGAGQGTNVQTSQDITIEEPDIDMGWYNVPARYSRSGAGVTYSAAALSDTGASFGTITVGSSIRAMVPVVGAATATTITATQLTRTGSTFATTGVRARDFVLVGTVYGIVTNVESETVLGVEEWLNRADNSPAATPLTSTQFEVRRPAYGRYAGGGTATSLPIDWWQQLNGTVLTGGSLPAAGTLYEVCYDHTFHPVNFEAGSRAVTVKGGHVKRGYGDQVRFLGDDCRAIDVTVEDGQDVGIEHEGGSGGIVSNCTVLGSGAVGILVTNDAVVEGNEITDTPYLNPTTPPVWVVGSKSQVKNNRIRRGRILSTMMAYGIRVEAVVAGGANDNVVEGNIVSGTTTADIILAASAGNVARPRVSSPIKPEVALYATTTSGGNTVVDIIAPIGTGTNRPSATVVPPGFVYWNTTTDKANFSDGSGWNLADGTAA